MHLKLKPAAAKDADAIAALRTAAGHHLTTVFGPGHWSNCVSAKAVLHRMRTASVFLARQDRHVVATLSLGTRKPWAMDRSCFPPARLALYLTDMAVAPDFQRHGIGRQCMEEAQRLARAWPADAIRLDAYDAPAGAGGFYRKCGFREVARASYRKVPLIYLEWRL